MTQADRQKVLYVCHNHPAVRPGGAEGYALDLYEEIRAAGEFDPIFLARNGPPMSPVLRNENDTLISAVNGDQNQYFFYTDLANWDWVYGRPHDKEGLTWDFRQFLLAHEPDLIHFQHTVWMGYEMLRVARNTLPDVPIVYMLHEYLPICQHNGQMVRRTNGELCQEQSPRRCHECFPEISQQTFYMRKRFIQSHLNLVDMFIAPSEYVRDRYVDWGIPASKIQVETYACRPMAQPLPRCADRPRNRFGFFGQFTPFKGADVLLEAMEILGEDFDGHLRVHGANLDTAPPEFQEQFAALLDGTKKTVTMVGQYDHGTELFKLMSRIDWVVVPSIWWETGPLVVLEAFLHGRPVITSDIGGMSEKVEDGVSGLHFRTRDADDLARVMRRAAETPGLWDELRAGIPPVPMISDHAVELTALYKRLLSDRRHPAAAALELSGQVAPEPLSAAPVPLNENRSAGKKKILFVSMGHPTVRPGGAEGYSLEVYELIRDAGEFEATFLARSGPPYSIASRYHEGRPITTVNDDPNQYLFYTEPSDYDWFFGRSPNKTTVTRFFKDFLEAHQPDLVHFQHSMFFGYDILRVTRNTLPDAPIVYTLHEYLPICYRDGQMVRRPSNELCLEESPRRCHECFPEISEQAFYARKRFIQSHLSIVDMFVTPSPHTLEQYVRWGIPREKIRHEAHGYSPVTKLPEPKERNRRDRFGFFGKFSRYKGTDVLLEAMAKLGQEFDGHLWIHGTSLDGAPEDERERFAALLEEAEANVTLVGEYQQKDLAMLMSRVDWVVVPSIWWETGPLVVLEAFLHGRPVICSDIGGMAEKVQDGVSGLHFRRADPADLAEVMRQAAATPGLWEQLRSGIPPVRTMDDHVSSLRKTYVDLLASRSAEVLEPSREIAEVPQHG